MEEAIEICKLRFFLKLVAQVDDVNEIEPLPDIDFNIRAGNTLVGFTKYEELLKTAEGNWVKEQEIQEIEKKAQDVDLLFNLFHEQQEGLGGDILQENKISLQKNLLELENKLNEWLAQEYEVNIKNENEYKKWLHSHKPFHWIIDFHEIIKNGGFDVIIGNPPYVEYSKVKKEYTIIGYNTQVYNNLYPFIVERCFEILNKAGFFGMIVPISSICTDRMHNYIDLFEKRESWFSLFAERPAKLFEGAEIQLAITLSKTDNCPKIYSTNYNKWETKFRNYLFRNLSYTNSTLYKKENSIPKIGNTIEKEILDKIYKQEYIIRNYKTRNSKYFVAYRNAGGRYYKIVLNYEPLFKVNGRVKRSSTYQFLHFDDKRIGDALCSVMNSSLFYWYWLIFSDTWHMINRDIDDFPIEITEDLKCEIIPLTEKVMDDLLKNSIIRTEKRNKGKDIVEFVQFAARNSKSIIDKIDTVLAKYYGFTSEELDFIINYDIKYRIGDELNNEEVRKI